MSALWRTIVKNTEQYLKPRLARLLAQFQQIVEIVRSKLHQRTC